MQSLGMGHALWLHGYMATWQANRLICFCILRTEGIDDDDSCRKLVAKVAWLEPFGGNNQTFFPLTALVLDTFFLNDYVYIYI